MNHSSGPLQQPTFTALVLAGQRDTNDPVAQAAGLTHKCLVPVAGIPMVNRVVDTLINSPGVGAIVVSIENPALLDDVATLTSAKECGKVRILPSSTTPSRSVRSFIDHQQTALPLLITTADHPLLTVDMVDFFLEAARSSRADVLAGLTPAQPLRMKYPEAKRTFLKFRDGDFCGCNLFAITTREGVSAVDFWQRVERERKRPWRIVQALGFCAVISYLLGRLTLKRAMERASRAIGATVQVIQLPMPEAAIDVDKPEDLDLAERILTTTNPA